jgi:hypothetical protein
MVTTSVGRRAFIKMPEPDSPWCSSADGEHLVEKAVEKRRYCSATVNTATNGFATGRNCLTESASVIPMAPSLSTLMAGFL